MPFFFDYIYYRITKAYFKLDGREGITAIIAISLIQALLIADIAALAIRMVYNRPSTAPYAKVAGYISVLILIALIVLNRFKYKQKYNKLRSHWKNETKAKRIFKGLLVILSLILPWIPLFVVGCTKL